MDGLLVSVTTVHMMTNRMATAQTATVRRGRQPGTGRLPADAPACPALGDRDREQGRSTRVLAPRAI
ncbi:hypothetical protein BCD48_06590 [Pseudofrankia sp. BMG5.36]|nr:hypothetical protein BCD48_06590 [Pseudofrankia sp. BMG5.36]